MPSVFEKEAFKDLYLLNFQHDFKMMDHTASERLMKQLNAWCGLHGLMYTDGKFTWTHAPLSLVPNAFPRASFEYVRDIQVIWNKLVDRLSRDRSFILKELREVSDADEFTQRLMRLYETVPDEVLKEGIQFGIFRSDYMINHDLRPLQVEINTISSSFGSLTKKVSLFHKHLLQRNLDNPELASLIHKVMGSSAKSTKDVLDAIENNQSLENLAAALAAAHRAYGKENSVVLFIVQPNERNVSRLIYLFHHISS